MTAAVKGATLHALVEGSGPPVVLLHGGHGSALDFSLRLTPLLASRFTTIAVDRPGAGRSGRPPGADTPRAQARLLRELVAGLGVERPILVGHSLGAAVALAWALDAGDEVRALVTIGGYFLPGDYRPPLASALGLPLAGPLLAATVVPVVGRVAGPSFLRRIFQPEQPDEQYARATLRDALKPSHLLHDAADRRALDDGLRELVASYSRLGPPLVAVAGLQDAVVSPWQSRRLAEMVPHAELRLLPATGHVPHVTKPRAVAAAVDRAAALASLQRSDARATA